MHWECRYCERPAPYAIVKTDEGLMCMCGAEWEDAKILVEVEEVYDDGYEIYDEDDDRLPCGCCACCGCSCDDEY